MKNVYKISDILFEIEYYYKLTDALFKPYLYSGSDKVSEFISVSNEDIDLERNLSSATEPAFLEYSCILRKFAKICLTKYQTLLFHASAIKYKGGAYLFTAQSGTGKSTHTRLLKEFLGDEVEYINDDKPTIRFDKQPPVVYGNPWCGKHILGGNVSAPLKAVVKVVRSDSNSAFEISAESMLKTLIEQVYKPNDNSHLPLLLNYISKINKSTKFYQLNCNTDVSSAKCSYENILSKWGNVWK